MAVNLTRIYTRTGDAGETRLGDNSDDLEDRSAAGGVRRGGRGELRDRRRHRGRAPEQHPGGAADPGSRTTCSTSAPTCATRSRPNPEYPPLRITQEYVDRLEGWCDDYNSRLTKLRSFILPGGTEGAAYLNVARAVVRRAERAGWAAVEAHGPSVNLLAITYLNRLSDLLFILGRVANLSSGGDVLGSRAANEAVT